MWPGIATRRAALVCGSMSSVATPPSAAPTNPPRERLISGPFVSVMVTATAFFFYIGMVIVTVPSFVERRLGAGELGVGLTMASFACAAIFARPYLGRLTELRPGRYAKSETSSGFLGAIDSELRARM